MCFLLLVVTKTNSYRQHYDDNLRVVPNQHQNLSITAYPRRHETLNLDWNAEFRNAEFRFS
jgi:hypothetical protein